MRVFDRGHLVRRLDATWGPTTAQATRNGNDTFHFTNCSPQHVTFNEGHQLWAGIEDFVLAHAQNEKCMATVINGPVFRKTDRKAQGILIPAQFFKIAVFAKGDELAAAGFLLSQASLLEQDLPVEEQETLKPLKPGEAKVFQRPISAIAKLTGLDFGTLSSHDEGVDALEGLKVAQPLETLEDIRI
jgi:endonuclease G